MARSNPPRGINFPYPGNSFKDRHGTPISAEPLFGHRDLVLVTDSSFLKAFDNGHLWAQHEWLRAKYDALTSSKEFKFHVPSHIIDEYNASLNGKRRDSTGLPFARGTIEDLLGERTHPQFSLKSLTPAMALAEEAWRKSYMAAVVDENPGVKIGKLRRALRHGPTLPDLSVLASAIILAELGAVVYVVSSDLKDVIKPLSFLKKAPNITPRPPSPVELKYFKGSGKWLEAVLTEEVVSDLHWAVESENSFPVVVFETNVRSGDAVFDVGVGVEQQQYGRPVQLPAKYECIMGEHVDGNRIVGGKHRIVPVVRVQRVSYVERLAEAFKRHPGQQLLVFTYERPYEPLLVKPSNPLDPIWYEPFMVGRYFLSQRTNSLFAMVNFEQGSKEPKLLEHLVAQK